MVAVCELVLIHHNTRLGICWNIIKTPRHSTVFIDIGEEGFDGILDRVSTAERTDCSGLGKRVSLLFDVTLNDALLPFGYRPLRRIMPIRVPSKDLVRVQQFALHLVEDELSVRRSAGPVHQAARLIGRVIEQLDADVLCDLSGYRTVFIWSHLTGQRDDQTQTGLFRRVLMGAVEKAMEGKEHLDLVDDVRGSVVHVQRKTRTGQHTVFLAASAFEGAENETAHILDVILLGLAKFTVLLDRFSSTMGRGNTVTELGKFHIDQIPLSIHTGITCTNSHSNPSLKLSIFRWSISR